MTAKSHSHIGLYLAVFGALIVLTVVTVGVSYLHMAVAAAVGVALIIAITKGSLVMAYFMHLKGEHRLIFYLLGITLFLLVFILIVPFLVGLDDYQIVSP